MVHVFRPIFSLFSLLTQHMFSLFVCLFTHSLHTLRYGRYGRLPTHIYQSILLLLLLLLYFPILSFLQDRIEPNSPSVHPSVRPPVRPPVRPIYLFIFFFFGLSTVYIHSFADVSWTSK